VYVHMIEYGLMFKVANLQSIDIILKENPAG
jgi:hypothetical protein